ncbi:hypothetical protein GGP68_002936 [Salinibacter ruber]|nr:hypothetical protein [Salinibacter ruber]
MLDLINLRPIQHDTVPVSSFRRCIFRGEGDWLVGCAGGRQWPLRDQRVIGRLNGRPCLDRQARREDCLSHQSRLITRRPCLGLVDPSVPEGLPVGPGPRRLRAVPRRAVPHRQKVHKRRPAVVALVSPDPSGNLHRVGRPPPVFRKVQLSLTSIISVSDTHCRIDVGSNLVLSYLQCRGVLAAVPTPARLIWADPDPTLIFGNRITGCDNVLRISSIVAVVVFVGNIEPNRTAPQFCPRQVKRSISHSNARPGTHLRPVLSHHHPIDRHISVVSPDKYPSATDTFDRSPGNLHYRIGHR